MKRRDFLACFPLLAAPSALGASSMRVVGMVDGRYPRFIEELKRLGWIDGRNMRLVVPQEGFGSQELIDGFVRMPVDLLVIGTTVSLRRAVKSTRTIPIVAILQFPVEDGYAKSLARPGGNVTGFTTDFADAHAKCLVWLKQAAPRVGTIAVLREGEGAAAIIDLEDASSGPHGPHLPGLKRAARAQGLRLVDIPIPLAALDAGDTGVIGPAVAAAIGLGVDAMLVPAFSIMGRAAFRAWFHGLCLRHKLPTIHMHLVAESGGLLAYGVTGGAYQARLAYYADKVLRGSRPAELPIEQVVHRELHVNLKTAALLGLMVPRSLLLQADRVFE